MADPAAVPSEVRDWVLQELEDLKRRLVLEFLTVVGAEGLSIRFISLTHDPASVAAHTGDAFAIAAPAGTVKTGDWLLLMPPSPGNRGVRYHATSPAIANDSVTIQAFNSDTGPLDHGSMTFNVIVFHPPSQL